MKLFILICFISLLASIQMKSIESDLRGNKSADEPRIFFRQMIEASGLFPYEINVPDTVSAMMSGLSSMYDTMSMLFGSGSSGSGGSESEVQQDQVNANVASNTNAIRMSQKRKKKVKKIRNKKLTSQIDDYNYDYYLNYFSL